MFNINWNKIIDDNLDDFARQPKRVNRLRTMVKEVANNHAKFLIYRDDVFKKIYHNGQVIYLEKILNDEFDNISRGIYIDSNLTPDPYYLFKKSELQPPVYLYKKWNATHPFVLNEYCEYNGIIYTVGINNTNKNPESFPSFWASVTTVKWLRTKADFFNSINFIVYVPTSLVFDISQMKALINYYKQAGKNYLIKLY